MPIVDESRQNKGVTTGSIGGLIDIVNNMDYQRYNPHTRSYNKRLIQKNIGN